MCKLFAVEGVDGGDSEETTLGERVRSVRVDFGVEEAATGDHEGRVGTGTDVHYCHVLESLDLATQTTRGRLLQTMEQMHHGKSRGKRFCRNLGEVH